MLLSAGQFNSMQGLLKHWLEQQRFHGLLMRSPHFDIMLNVMKWYNQHLAACEPTSSAMLLSAGHFNSMQGLVKRWLEQQSSHGLPMQPCLADIMTILGQVSLVLRPWPISSSCPMHCYSG